MTSLKRLLLMGVEVGSKTNKLININQNRMLK